MILRQPYLPRFMAGGPGNPLGASAMYLGSSQYRIHGTNDPSTIGKFVSSGCIRLTNEDVTDLFSRVDVGTRVVVLPKNGPHFEAGAMAGGDGCSAGVPRSHPVVTTLPSGRQAMNLSIPRCTEDEARSRETNNGHAIRPAGLGAAAILVPRRAWLRLRRPRISFRPVRRVWRWPAACADDALHYRERGQHETSPEGKAQRHRVHLYSGGSQAYCVRTATAAISRFRPAIRPRLLPATVFARQAKPGWSLAATSKMPSPTVESPIRNCRMRSAIAMSWSQAAPATARIQSVSRRSGSKTIRLSQGRYRRRQGHPDGCRPRRRPAGRIIAAFAGPEVGALPLPARSGGGFGVNRCHWKNWFLQWNQKRPSALRGCGLLLACIGESSCLLVCWSLFLSSF